MDTRTKLAVVEGDGRFRADHTARTDGEFLPRDPAAWIKDHIRRNPFEMHLRSDKKCAAILKLMQCIHGLTLFD
jgi:hypothetical protein